MIRKPCALPSSCFDQNSDLGGIFHSDYQIDVGTEAGMTEYKRIIDRNAELGITHIVYEPFNSLRSSRKTATDGWGWEGSLWLSMGEQIRNGSWAPAAGKKMPVEIQTMIDYAQSKQIKLMGYVYPCLDFVGGSKVPVGLYQMYSITLQTQY